MRFLICIAVAGCASSPDGDVVGPFTGQVQRFVVDSFTLPATQADARAIGDDLNGDKTADNQFGSVVATLAGQNDVTTHGGDMIAAGVIASSVEIQADSFSNDDSVSVTYLGADGEPATAVGGRFANLVFRSNRTLTTDVPGDTTMHVPVFRDADPSVIALVGMELDLVPDGAGGYNGTVRGAFPADQVFPVVLAGVVQMIHADPAAHRAFTSILDQNHDAEISLHEVETNSLFQSLLSPDVDLFASDGSFDPVHGTQGDSLSAAIQIHLTPCAAGRCSTSAPADRCKDRVLDGNETDVDCGGSCSPCAPAQACKFAGDCQSNACDAGSCRAASCTDGVRDGFEADLDCGGLCETKCAIGKSCDFDTDCATGRCGQAGLGGTRACAH